MDFYLIENKDRAKMDFRFNNKKSNTGKVFGFLFWVGMLCVLKWVSRSMVICVIIRFLNKNPSKSGGRIAQGCLNIVMELINIKKI